MSRALRWRAAPALAALALGAAACGSGTGSSGSAGGTADVTVHAKNIAYNPASVAVPAAGTITVGFDNQDGVTHSFTLDDDASKSVDADPGSIQTLQVTVPAGGLKFHCRFHPSMHGQITVGGSSGGGAASSGSGASTTSGYGY